MKKIIIMILVFAATASAVAQKKEDLIKTLQDKEKEIRKLNNQLDDERKAREKSEAENEKSNSTKVAELRRNIKQINEVFLREIFNNIYVNKPYLTETDLEKEDISGKIKKSNVIATSLLLDDTNKDVYKLCQKVLDFNKNYLKLYDINKSVLSEKYNAKNVKESLADIKDLPDLEKNSKLDITKDKISRYLENYNDNTCKLKEELEKLMRNPDQNNTFKAQYTKLENKEEYKDYPYLIEVIKRVKNNKADYSKNDLQPCEEKEPAEIPKNKAPEKTTKQDPEDKRKKRK